MGMVNIYVSDNSAEAHMLKHFLEQNGIMTLIQGEFLQGALGEIGAHNHIRLSVIDEDVEQARTLMKEWEDKSSDDNNA